MAFEYVTNRESTGAEYVAPTDEKNDDVAVGDEVDKKPEGDVDDTKKDDAEIKTDDVKKEDVKSDDVTETEEQKIARVSAEELEATKTTNLKLAVRKEFLEEMGFASEEELKAAKAKFETKPKTQEEIDADLEAYNKNLTAYAIQQGKLSTKDISEIENIRGMDDVSIALRDFATEYKDANKDRGADDPVTEDEIKDAFDKLYHTDSDNAVLKGRGERLMKEVADKIKGQSESKLATAKNEYDIVLEKQKTIPAYEKFVKETVSKNLPDEIVVAGEGDDAIVFKLKDDKGNPRYDLKEIESLFVDNTLFNKFTEGKDPKAVEDIIKENVIEYIEKKNKVAIRELIMDQGKNLGRKEGSTTGGKAPFETKDVKPVITNDKELSPEQRVTMNQRYGKLY